jgi:hypothetical protein
MCAPVVNATSTSALMRSMPGWVGDTCEPYDGVVEIFVSSLFSLAPHRQLVAMVTRLESQAGAVTLMSWRTNLPCNTCFRIRSKSARHFRQR